MSLPWPPQQQLLIARSHARSFEETARRSEKTHQPQEGGRGPLLRVPDPLSHGRLKIGYLSRDFYDHPVAHQMQSLFGLHDRERFEIHSYSFGPNDGSTYRKRIEQGCEHFHDVANLSVADLEGKIREDGIQILVDLMGYTGLARTACVARRPAPIQVNWLGYSGTTGASFIDYIIGDPQVTPLEHAENFSEKIVQLPHSYMVTDDEQPIAETAGKRADHGLPEEGLVFCCFNNAYKIDPGMFDIWMKVLRETPESVLWLSVGAPLARANLRREAEARGIDPKRIVFAEHVRSKAEHLARYRLADLFLDTSFYNAHATACDVLWAGLPLLTCAGETFASRVGMSFLTTMGVTELITHDLAEYERVAINLAHDHDQLYSLREKLASQRAGSPLFDTPRFVRGLEQAFEKIWEIHASGGPARAISIS
jgi:predicted O-linked N-acetylglucosamine transferase (SPINDLY family)